MKNLISKLPYFLALTLIAYFSINSCKKTSESKNGQTYQSINNTSLFSHPDTIIRFFDDSVGIGYISNGIFYIDNIDTSNYQYTENGINYTMSHFRIEEVQGNYDFLMFGTGANGEHILVGFPCFIDAPDYINPNAPTGCSGVKNSCSGVCCASCTFTRNGSGCVDGCACGRANTGCGTGISPHCDHSVSETGSKSSYQDYILDYSNYPPYDTY